ncbi:MAG: hypothetical protein R3Y35_06855 [Clostridia bacterium]
MKAKSFHCSPKGLALPIASAIGDKLKCVCDKMPPAYPCDADKIVFIGAEMKNKAPKEVNDFCRELTLARTKYVAFYVINGTGDTSGLDSIIASMKANGVETVGGIHTVVVKSSLFKAGTTTQADIDSTLAWVDGIISSI